MAKSSTAKAIVIAGLVLAVAAVAVFLLSEKRYNWNENYKESAIYPYGSSLLKGMLKHRAGKPENFIEVNNEDDLVVYLPDSGEKATYVYIGREYYATQADVNVLFSFVEKGNTAFIASHTFNYRLLDACFLDIDGTRFIETDDDDDIYYWDAPADVVLSKVNDSTARLHLYDDVSTRLSITYLKSQKPANKVWHYFNEDLELNRGADLDIFGELEDHGPNFIGFRYGEGYFYLHCNPLAFSNLVLATDSGFAYAASAFDGGLEEKIVWDSFNRDFRFEENSYTPPRSQHEDGFLKFILSERSLRNAWFVLLTMAIAYLIFGARRVQKPIPVIHPHRNTSIDFAETMGAMYRMEGEHAKLSDLKMRLFKAHIRDRYSMRTKDLHTDLNGFIARLSERSHVDQQTIRDIFEIYQIIEGRNDPEGHKLIRLHNAIEKFHLHAR
ncbi:MAG: DUF4350 domain-containing protein [Flavobacteriales bacterium]